MDCLITLTGIIMMGYNHFL